VRGETPTNSDNRTFTTERRGPVAKRRPGPHVCVSNAHAVVYEQSRRVTRDQQDWIWDWVDRQRAAAASNAERSTQLAGRRAVGDSEWAYPSVSGT
jgi:hypothetical protein